MVSHTTERFWKSFEELPADVQARAKKAYEIWEGDHYHESLQFKKVHPKRPIYSVRIGRDWRAIGIKEDETITWFWIGSHSDYDKLIDSM